jgi:molybdopterin converting factor subunit 1
MKVKVLLFAQLRELAGKGEVVLEVEPGSRVLDLPGKLFPTGGISVLSRVRFAVNQDYVPAETVLKEGDEAALIPPVAGG